MIHPFFCKRFLHGVILCILPCPVAVSTYTHCSHIVNFAVYSCSWLWEGPRAESGDGHQHHSAVCLWPAGRCWAPVPGVLVHQWRPHHGRDTGGEHFCWCSSWGPADNPVLQWFSMLHLFCFFNVCLWLCSSTVVRWRLVLVLRSILCLENLKSALLFSSVSNQHPFGSCIFIFCLSVVSGWGWGLFFWYVLCL